MIGRMGVGCNRTFTIMISEVQRKIALGSGTSGSARPLYNTIQSNGWKEGFQLGPGL